MLLQYQSTRPFYIQVEMPTTAIKGEMIGVRVALFNYWDQTVEVGWRLPSRARELST